MVVIGDHPTSRHKKAQIFRGLVLLLDVTKQQNGTEAGLVYLHERFVIIEFCTFRL